MPVDFVDGSRTDPGVPQWEHLYSPMGNPLAVSRILVATRVRLVVRACLELGAARPRCLCGNR